MQCKGSLCHSESEGKVDYKFLNQNFDVQWKSNLKHLILQHTFKLTLNFVTCLLSLVVSNSITISELLTSNIKWVLRKYMYTIIVLVIVYMYFLPLLTFSLGIFLIFNLVWLCMCLQNIHCSYNYYKGK